MLKDAAGNTPKELTTFEKKWRESVSSGDTKERMQELQLHQALPLEAKIKLTTEKIQCWYESFNGNMKKEPMKRYEKEYGRKQYVGTMAQDSKAREKVYLQNGCNGYDLKDPKSTPMGFWTEQDVLQAIGNYNIPIPSVYGDIRRKGNGELYCTGVKRTGCVFCMFALHMEPSPGRFQKLYHSHPKLYRYCMDNLGIGDVLNYVYKNCPDRTTAQKFSGQITLF